MNERRTPVELAQVDGMSCFTNVVAQVRWMFGTSDRIDAAAVHEVDRLTGRRPGRPAEKQPEILLLAREGYRIVSVDEHLDVARLRSEGAAYMRELYGSSWTDADAGLWTPRKIVEYTRKAVAFQRRFDRLFTPYVATGQVRVVHARPHLRYIDRFLDLGYVVLGAVDTRHRAYSHAILVYGRRGRVYDVYVPRLGGERGAMLDWRLRGGLAHSLVPGAGFVAVRRDVEAASLAVAA